MAFETNTKTNKNKFVASMVSNTTGHTASWVNLTETFCLKVFGKKIIDITAEEAQEKLPPLYNNKFLSISIKDIEAEIEIIEATDF